MRPRMRPRADRLPPSASVAGIAHTAHLGALQTLAGWPLLLGRALFYCLIMVVLSALWDRVAAQQAMDIAAGAIRLPDGDLALYVGATEWVTLALPAVYLRFEDDIRGGGLDAHLLRPRSYLVQTIALGCGSGLARLAVLGVTGLLLLVASGRPMPEASTFVALAVLGPLAMIVGVLLYSLVGLTAFWARRTLPFQLVTQKFMFLLGGLFAPVSLYPAAAASFAECTPFAAHLHWVGVQALSPSWSFFVEGVWWQLVWIVLLAASCSLLWTLGIRRTLRQGSP